MLPLPLRGIVVPLVTPLAERGKLDRAGLDRLLEHVLAGGVHGIFLLGTTGEGPALSRPVRREMVEQSCGRIAGRVPVLVGITDASFDEAVELAGIAQRAGADAVVYAGPSYFPVSQEELADHVRRLAARLPLPLFLYNMPSHTGVAFEAATVVQAAGIPNVRGLKDSSGNMLYFQKLRAVLADHPGFSLLVGPEELLGGAVLAGAHGGVNGGANLLPRLYVRLYEAAVRRDAARMLELHGVVMRVSGSIYGCGSGPSSYLRGLKCALSVAGICGDVMAEPYTPFGGEERERIARALAELRAEPAAASVS